MSVIKYRQAEATYFADVEVTGNCLHSKQTSISVAGSECLSLEKTQVTGRHKYDQAEYTARRTHNHIS